MNHPPVGWAFGGRVLLKASGLFILFNLMFALAEPLPLIGQLSVYNRLVPGRERLPYGENPASYNLSLNSLDAMFASHVVTAAKPADEFRVLVLGDSSVWGILLRPDETVSTNLNAEDYRIDGKPVRAYNIGHPIMSVTKDLLLLDYARRYEPDLIVWLVTLESLPYSRQIETPLVQQNAARIRPLIDQYDLNLDRDDPRFVDPDWIGRTIVGQRRALADWWRLQLYGFAWSNTGIDQVYGEYTPRSNDFEVDVSWQDYVEPVALTEADLAFDVIRTAHTMVDETPLVLVNEPIYRADGRNSDLRYNFWYPQWAYDQYRALLAEMAEREGWSYLDAWDAIPPGEFTDSPVHLTPAGSQQLSQVIGRFIVSEITQHE